jgi:hypothetical protein
MARKSVAAACGRATQLGSAPSLKLKIVMAALVAAIHFPEAYQDIFSFWKMDGPDKPGHDEFGLDRFEKDATWAARPHAAATDLRAMTV